MCYNLSVVLDCACSNRVLEIHDEINSCNCLKIVLFQRLEVTFCKLCEQYDSSIEKICNIIEYFIGEDSSETFYSEDPLLCVEKIYRDGRYPYSAIDSGDADLFSNGI